MATYKGIGYDDVNGKNRTGSASDTISFATGVAIDGNLEVVGNIISRDEERVLVQDNFLDINFGYTTDSSGLEGGLAVNYLAVAGGRTIDASSANITFSAASGGNRPKLSVAQAQLPNGTFADGDILQIAGTTNAENDGLYVVHSLSNTNPAILEVKSTVGALSDTINAKFAQINFTGETESTSTSVTLTKVNIAALQVNTSGVYQVANGNVDSSFSSFTNLGISTLQQAYDAGNTILTDGSGAITFTLAADNQGFSVQGSSAGNGDVSIGGTTAVSSYSINASGAASTINSTGQDLTVKTTTSGALAVTSAGTLAVTGASTSTFGDDTAVWSFNGSGAVTETGMTTFALTPSSSVEITAGSTCAIASASGSAMTVGDGVLTLSATSGALSESGLTNLDLSGSGTMNLTGGGVSTFGDDTAVWRFDGAGALSETGMTTMDMSPSSTFNLDAGGAITVDGASLNIGGDNDTAGISIKSSGEAMDLIVASDADEEDLTLQVTGANNASIILTSSGTGDDAISLATSAGGMTMIAGSGAGDIEIATEGATKMARIVSNFPMFVRQFTAGTGGVAVGDCVFVTNDSGTADVIKCDADAASTSQFIGVAMNNASENAAVNVIVAGISNSVTGAANYVVADIGKKLYLSTDAGKIQTTPPSGSGDVVFQVGICVGGTTSSTTFQVLLQPQFIMEIG